MEDILNPKGIHIAGKSLVLQAYANRYNVLRQRILWACCIHQTSFFVHMRIPSENPYCTKIWYDILFEFYPLSQADITAGTLRNYGIKVYSNYPPFMFAFTYVYNKYDLLIPWLKQKCSKQALFDPPVKTNPQQIPGVDIKMWIAMFHIKTIGLIDKRKFQIAINTSIQHISKIILSQETMLVLRTKAEKFGKETAKAEGRQKAKQIAKGKRRELERAAVKGIEENLRAEANRTHQHINNTRTIAKNLVKLAKSARTARAVNRAKTPKQARETRRKR